MLQICETMMGNRNAQLPVGPELRGGVLLFFPSYTAMEAAVQHWTSTGLLERLKRVMGSVVMEPRGGEASQKKGTANSSGSGWGRRPYGRGEGTVQPTAGFATTTSAGHSSVTKSVGEEGDEDRVVSGVVAEFESAIRTFGKCLLMAVCR